MKRIALVFLIAILIPSLLLAGLAIRSVRDQEVVLNSQKGLLHQATCDSIAADINLFMDDVRVFYGSTVSELIETHGEDLVTDFDRLITENWSQASVGSVVSDAGAIQSPSAKSGPRAVTFLENHSDFLTNRRVVEVYQAPQVLNRQLQVVEEKSAEVVSSGSTESLSRDTSQSGSAKPETSARKSFDGIFSLKKRSPSSESDHADAEPEVPAQKWKVSVSQNRMRDFRFDQQSEQVASPAAESDAVPASAAPATVATRGSLAKSESADSVLEMAERAKTVPDNFRNVAPAQGLGFGLQQMQADGIGGQGAASTSNQSRLNPEAVKFNDLTESGDEGAVSRLIEGRLHVLLWKRHAALPGYTFWTELNLGSIREDLSALFQSADLPGSEEVSLALLDSNGDLVVQSQGGFSADWTRPFVAAEVGQILPRWEVAAYLLNPRALSESARTVRLTLWLIVLILVAAVSVGSLLILKSVNYEMRLASQKTDFVSNVSHELKTPLTSIRMFSELLAGAEEHDAERTRNYSEVISKESARLTRLINQLLDFSRLDRGEVKLQKATVDLGSLAEETVECFRPQMEAEDLEVKLQVDREKPLVVDGDRDALSQVILNLLSNAEKYAAEGGEILVEVKPGTSDTAIIAVHDRGKGIPKAHQGRIFDKFYRVDDSIDSGIDGSGIGLALCRQIAEKHGGEIRYGNREGGGSSFLITLPTGA